MNKECKDIVHTYIEMYMCVSVCVTCYIPHPLSIVIWLCMRAREYIHSIKEIHVSRFPHSSIHCFFHHKGYWQYWTKRIVSWCTRSIQISKMRLSCHCSTKSDSTKRILYGKHRPPVDKAATPVHNIPSCCTACHDLSCSYCILSTTQPSRDRMVIGSGPSQANDAFVNSPNVQRPPNSWHTKHAL